MKTYEYQLITQPKGLTAQQVENLLNDMGNDGWELCGTDYGCFMMKKEREAKP